MAFFRNDTVNLLNLHYGIHALALSGGSAFFAAFLLHSGVPARAVLASLAAILAGRFVIRPFILVPARQWGLKPLVIAGTAMTGLQYPPLAEVHGVESELFVLCAISAVGDTVYWTSYHAYFASLGDAEHRGHRLIGDAARICWRATQSIPLQLLEMTLPSRASAIALGRA
jgi:DHA1 family inner membrane transport protein